MSNKFIYVFGPSRTEGAAEMKNILGGKGANLAEMCRLGISVPPGLTISSEVCAIYSEQGPDAARKLIYRGLDEVKARMREAGLEE